MLVRHVHVAVTDEIALAQAQPFMREGLAGQRGVNLAREVRPDASPERKKSRGFTRRARGLRLLGWRGTRVCRQPDTVIAAIEAQQKLIGYDVLLAHHHITTMPDDLVTESLRLFGEKVIPAFSGVAIAT